MRYLKDIQESGMGTWYFEMDNNGTAYRQIVFYEDSSCITSNRKHDSYHFMWRSTLLIRRNPIIQRSVKRHSKSFGWNSCKLARWTGIGPNVYFQSALKWKDASRPFFRKAH
jgi:hypothetical protein